MNTKENIVSSQTRDLRECQTPLKQQINPKLVQSEHMSELIG